MKVNLFVWLLLVLASITVAFAPIPFASWSTVPISHTFRVKADQFSYQPAELQVNPGDIVTIELVSTDVVHGLYVDGYDVSIEADPGQTERLTFVADKPGSFRFRCNVTCGAMHPFMIGKLTVGWNDWLFRSIGLAVLAFMGFLFLSSFHNEKNRKEERNIT
ncbi:MAG TPA: cupredoxin domain-containing protein [Anaerolineales bacterium]|nr:cupredoxin domain-containing protein [Anaerolineales bacterium]